MPQVIRCAFDGLESRNMRKETASDESGLKQQSTSRIEHIARRTFFLQLANRLVQCQLHSHQGDYVESLLRSMRFIGDQLRKMNVLLSQKCSLFCAWI